MGWVHLLDKAVRNDPKRIATMQKAFKCYDLPAYGLKEPSLKAYDGRKKTVEELALICGLPYCDGKVG